MQDKTVSRWTHPSVILAATDLTDLDRLLKFAREQAKLSNARLILMHAISTAEGMTADLAGMPYYDPACVKESAGHLLELCCEAVRNRGVDCHWLVREGGPAQQILGAASQFHADRIILGSRSRGKLSKLLLGSVAEQVLRSASTPVLTVGPEARLPVDGHMTDQVVLHATTLREASRPSAVLACMIAAALNARLVLLHVLPPVHGTPSTGVPSSQDSAALHELQELAAELAGDCRVPIEAVLIHGHPAIEILAQSEHHSAALIVMGSTVRSGFQNLTHDRTVYKVWAHAHCPVLTLHDEQIKTETGDAARLALRS